MNKKYENYREIVERLGLKINYKNNWNTNQIGRKKNTFINYSKM